MYLWNVVVTEVRHVECLYTIEADDEHEAKRKAAIGDTVNEDDIKDRGVMDRHIESDVTPVGAGGEA